MKTIFFKKEFLKDIDKGNKTQTIRKKSIYKKDDICSINFNSKNRIKILEVYKKSLGDITHKEAKQDGFKGIQDLFNKLIEIYPEIDLTDEFYVIKFEKAR